MPNLYAVDNTAAAVRHQRVAGVERFALLKWLNTAPTIGSTAEFALVYERTVIRLGRSRLPLPKYPYALTIQSNAQTPPTEINDLSATAVSETQVNLSCSASIATAPYVIAQYNWYRDGALIGTSSVPTFSATGLSAWTQYTFRVEAVDNQPLSSGLSNSATVRTLDTTAPSAVSALAVTDSTDATIDVSHSGAADAASGVALYRYYRDGVLVASSAALTYQYSGLTVSTTYALGVRAVDAAGNEGPQSTVSQATSANVAIREAIVTEVEDITIVIEEQD